MYTFKKDNKEICVCWDSSLQSFVGKIYTKGMLNIWIGKNNKEIYFVKDLEDKLEIKLSSEIKSKLEDDKNKFIAENSITDLLNSF